jgi:hypothetical protein
MTGVPEADLCTNCGAPLELDDGGRCRWCHARVRVEQPWAGQSAGRGGQTGLIPRDDEAHSSFAPFVYLTLSAFSLLSFEPAVQAWTHRQPALHQQVRALNAAVVATGVRVRDGGLLEDDFDDSLGAYTPDEIWTFDLGIDVIAMLGALDGLRGGTRSQVASDLRSLDQSVLSRTWDKDLKKAGDGPPAFRDLRAAVPRHTPRPAR